MDETTEEKIKIVETLEGTKIEPFDGLPCSARIFTIKGVSMELEDFGHMESDDCSQSGCDGSCYGCHNKHFVSDSVSVIQENIKGKVEMTYEEIVEMCNHLEEIFYVGDCGWCS